MDVNKFLIRLDSGSWVLTHLDHESLMCLSGSCHPDCLDPGFLIAWILNSYCAIWILDSCCACLDPSLRTAPAPSLTTTTRESIN